MSIKLYLLLTLNSILNYNTNMQKVHYGYLDESGILEDKATAGNFFIISAIIVGHPSQLKHIIKQARRKAKGKFQSHKVFKASKENKGFVKLVLQEMAQRDIEIIIGAWDKKQLHAQMGKNVLYFKLIAQTVDLAVKHYPRLNLVIHKRYTLPRLRQQLETTLSQAIDTKIYLSIQQRSETECRELELADAVAWSVFQKYNHGNSEFYNIIKEKIQIENRLTA